MNFIFFSIGIALLFFVGSVSLLSYGRRLGRAHLARTGTDAAGGLSAVEGAVFALIGLLVAFTTSGALNRFDERRMMVVQEASAASIAYDRAALLEPSDSAEIRRLIREYVRARIDLYAGPHDFAIVGLAESWPAESLDTIAARKRDLWDAATRACPAASFEPPCALVLIALNNLFDAARQRLAAVSKHPHPVVFGMLLVLGLAGSLLAGFSMATPGGRSHIHTVVFSATLAVTFFVIVDMEYPRLGLIRIDGYDRFLLNVLAAWDDAERI
jgi:hypothetical protein